jgi:hypothetical protein
MVKNGDFANLLPRVRDVLQQLHDGMRYILQSPKVDALVISELPIAHVSVVFDNFTDMFRGKVLNGNLNINATSRATETHLFSHINVTTLSFLAVSFSLHLNPFLRLLRDD